jgi:Lon protease-like protein
VYPIGCSGVITHVERLQDGRYNIVLRGLDRFRIVEENHERSYRRAVVEPVAERRMTSDDRAIVRRNRTRLESLLAPALRHFQRESDKPVDPKVTAAMSDDDLVNALSQYLDLEPLEKQALLEHDCLRTRAESLCELLEMKIMMARTPGITNVAH